MMIMFCGNLIILIILNNAAVYSMSGVSNIKKKNLKYSYDLAMKCKCFGVAGL